MQEDNKIKEAKYSSREATLYVNSDGDEQEGRITDRIKRRLPY